MFSNKRLLSSVNYTDVSNFRIKRNGQNVSREIGKKRRLLQGVNATSIHRVLFNIVRYWEISSDALKCDNIGTSMLQGNVVTVAL